MKTIFLTQVTLLLAVREADGFLPRVSHCHGRTLLPPLHSSPKKENKSYTMNVFEPTTKGWRNTLMYMSDVKRDEKANRRDVGVIAALAFLSWTLLSAPTMASNSSSASSRSSRSSSSTRSALTRSSRTSSSLSSTRPSSSISSSASRTKSSPYQSTARSSTTSSSSTKTVSTSSAVSSSSNSSMPKGKRVTMSSPKSSTARLSTKPRVAAESVASNSNTKTAVSAGERVTMQTPKSSSARLKASKPTSPTTSTSAVSSPTKAKTKTPSPKLETNASPTPSTSPQKKAAPSSSKTSSTLSTTDKKNLIASPKAKKKDSSSPVAKETAPPLQKDAGKIKPIAPLSNGKSGSVVPKKDGVKKRPTKTSAFTESSADKNSLRKRSGKRVGGRAAKPNDSRESRTTTRSDQTIIRNTYIVTDPPSTRNYQGHGIQYYYFPPQNLGTAYYYNDYAPPLQQQQAYPPYRRPTCAISESNKQKSPPAVCKINLPVPNEPIDVLVDPIKGLYVQGTVTLVDQKTNDFTVTYLSADGYAIQKTFHAVPQKLF